MISDSEKQTKEIAANLIGKYLTELNQYCLILALSGDLGTGKTVFAKGIAEALGIKKVIRSPSFIIQKEFPFEMAGIRGNFVHIDLWRMENEKETAKLKIEEWVKPKNVILIEWQEKMGISRKKMAAMKDSFFLKIKFTFIDKNTRTIEIETE